jgi:tRNA A37 threonylcarbamoyladenosine modification protein TsaB
MSTALLISAQDIREFHVALVQGQEIQKEAHCAVAPELYLKTFADVLGEWEINLSEIDELIVVTGPGSFTASRVSVTIVNTLAYTKSIPLRGIENTKKLEIAALWDQVKDRLPEPSGSVLPSYDRAATITQPKK